MKPISIFIFALCATVTITAADAANAKKCVKLNASQSCNTPVSTDNSIRWSAICGSSSPYTYVRGIGLCGTTSTVNTVNLDFSITSGTGTGCWCKMLLPALSKYIYAGNLSSSANCLKTCANKCATMITTGSATFRSAMFNNLDN